MDIDLCNLKRQFDVVNCLKNLGFLNEHDIKKTLAYAFEMCNEGFKKRKGYTNLMKKLRKLEHLALFKSDANLLIMNFPYQAELADETRKVVIVDAENVYDSLKAVCKKIFNTDEKKVFTVTRLAWDTYLVKMKDFQTAKFLAEKMNGMIIQNQPVLLKAFYNENEHKAQSTTFFEDINMITPCEMFLILLFGMLCGYLAFVFVEMHYTN